jgi:kinesin family protein 11
MLAKWVIEERNSSEKAQADILQRFSGLLGEFFQKRDESLRESIGSLQRSNTEAEDLLASAGKRQAQDQEEMIHRNNEVFDRLQEFENQGHDARKKAAQVGLPTGPHTDSYMQSD